MLYIEIYTYIYYVNAEISNDIYEINLRAIIVWYFFFSRARHNVNDCIMYSMCVMNLSKISINDYALSDKIMPKSR